MLGQQVHDGEVALDKLLIDWQAGKFGHELCVHLLGQFIKFPNTLSVCSVALGEQDLPLPGVMGLRAFPPVEEACLGVPHAWCFADRRVFSWFRRGFAGVYCVDRAHRA